MSGVAFRIIAAAVAATRRPEASARAAPAGADGHLGHRRGAPLGSGPSYRTALSSGAATTGRRADRVPRRWSRPRGAVMAVPRRLGSAGDCSIGVTRDPLLDDRMRAALRFSDTGGRHHVVDLTLSDTRNLLEDLLVLLGANREQVDAWWARRSLIPAMVDQRADGGDEGRRAVVAVRRPARGRLPPRRQPTAEARGYGAAPSSSPSRDGEAGRCRWRGLS